MSRGCGKNSTQIAMGDKATYLGMEIDKVIDSDFEGLISDSNNCAGKINQIEIPHGRTNR